jgi:hypothetical protein
MSKTIVNLTIALIVITAVYVGYFVYDQYIESTPGRQFDSTEVTRMLTEANEFIAHKQTLSKVNIDTDIFSDSRFLKLRNFSTPIEQSSVGRTNPFAPAGFDAPITTQ